MEGGVRMVEFNEQQQAVQVGSLVLECRYFESPFSNEVQTELAI